MFGRTTRLTDDEAAAVLEDLHGPTTRAGHRLVRTALALAPDPSTGQSERHRRYVRDVMLREFDRGMDLPTRDNDEDGTVELPSHAPTLMVVDGVTVRMADLDAIDPERAQRAAARLVELAARAGRKA